MQFLADDPVRQIQGRKFPGVIWRGCRYYLTAEGYVERRHGPRGNSRSVGWHRDVWEAAFGPIPEGLHVHHINENKLDNRIANLSLVSNAGHGKIHAPRSIASLKQAIKNMPAMVRDCANCGNVFETKSFRKRYCSHACHLAERRIRGVPNDVKERAKAKKRQQNQEALKIKTCPWCSNEFRQRRRDQVYCCSSHGSAAGSERHRALAARN